MDPKERKRLPEAAQQSAFVNELPPGVVHIVNGERVDPERKLTTEQFINVLTYVAVKLLTDRFL